MRLFLHLLLVIVLLPGAWGGPEDEAFARFREGARDVETLAAVLPRLSSPEHRSAIREAFRDREKAPRADLVALLAHPMLATRLGALEILEELAGGDLSYNPWAAATSPENEAALARWRAWAGAPPEASASGNIFSEEQRRGYLRDILSEDADKAARSRHMLEAEGLPSVGFLETFLQETPALSAGHRARIREAQYQITLSRQLGDQASAAARHLAFGSRDQLLSSLATVRATGLLALPILRDFITHADPLVRETAIDAFIANGGPEAVAIVSPLLKQEADVNVIHGAMRRLKDIPGTVTAELVASFLGHADEDLLISAIQTSLSLSGDNADPRFASGASRKVSTASPGDAAVIAALADKRWRVRAAALEYITKRQLSAAKETCIGLLADPDEFVRFAAIKAIGALGAKEALPKLKAILLADETMAGPVIEGYGALSQSLDDELLARLDAAPPEARLAALRAIETNRNLSSLALRYVADPDLDVACAAIRHIAANSDLLGRDNYASAIVAALKSDQPAKTDAVLERLALPRSKKIDRRILESPADPNLAARPTGLDALYDAFILPGKAAPRKNEPPTLPNAQAEILRELLRRLGPGTSSEDRFRSALHLAKASQPEGFTTLLRDFSTFTTAQKTTISENLDGPSAQEAIPLLTALLRDSIPEVRAEAASAALSNDDARALVDLVLSELSRPGALLKPHETYNYRFESIVRSKTTASRIKNWALSVLQAPDTSTQLRILATISLRGANGSTVIDALKKHVSASDPLLRRAASHALFTIQPAEAANSAETIAGDHEAFVRVVLASAFNKGAAGWHHRFSDIELVPDARWSYQQTFPRLGDPGRIILARLADQDPSPLVRFEASFALLSQGAPVDIENFVALFPALSKDVKATERVTQWLSENAARATPGLRPLLAVIDPAGIKPEVMSVLQQKIQPSKDGGFATFASLARKENAATENLLVPDQAPAAPVARKSLKVVYFYKPGCPECLRAKQYLAAIEDGFPLLHLTEHNILEASGTVYNQALCARFSVPSSRHTLSPAIFTQHGFLIRDEINPQSLAKLFAETMAIAQDDSWMEIGEPEKQAASAAVDRRYAAFTLPLVIGAGLLDGVNPCAFATIIFFLSYLQIARRTPREMLMVGAAFISAVFIAYLSAGLLLYQSLAALNDRFAGIQKWMNIGFASLALVAAFLSFFDAFRARSGRLDEMTLQLPNFLKNRIRGVIRTTSRARNFVIAAFLSGIVISLLELACTGQVYAPIIYQIQQGRLDAVLWLVIYNIAFILPLVVIFLLAYSGLRSESLIAFQKKHTTAIKTGLGILFLILSAVILFARP